MPTLFYRRHYLILPAIMLILSLFSIAAIPVPSSHHNSADTISPVKKKAAKKTAAPEEKVFTFTSSEKYPSFRGGEAALQAYLHANIIIPAAAARAGINTDVLIKFIVDKTGTLKNIHVAGAPKGYGLDEEALRVVTNMPTWKPGNISGRSISVYDSLLIHFDTVANVLHADTAIKEATINDSKDDGTICWVDPEGMPVFPGGEKAFDDYLKKNVTYPAAALKAKVSGTVFVQFVVGHTGIIRDVRTVGPYKGYGMEAEAIMVVCNMPKWKPGKMNGKYTDVFLNLPIRFIYTPQKAK